METITTGQVSFAEQGKDTHSPSIIQHWQAAINDIAQPEHSTILSKLKQHIAKIDYRQRAQLEEEEKIKTRHIVVVTIDELLNVARSQQWQLCRNDAFTYLYNGAYWRAIDREALQAFFGECAELMGVKAIDAKHHLFRRELEKQFDAIAHFPTPEPDADKVLVNLLNGTFEICSAGQQLRAPKPDDFLLYQLQFPHEPTATAPKWQTFLDKVQPDRDVQKVLQEYIGYVFTNGLNLETTLLLYGSGANGKSVFIDVISAMLGAENVSCYSLESLTKTDSYTRANLANKLLNCANEISGKLQSDIFKQLVSGQPVEARMIYKEPFIMKRYAKLLFACNEYPREVEQTNGFFRRLKIVPFNQTIPASEQNTELAKEIISTELSGVFNWALEGLQRLLKQKRFSECAAIEAQNAHFRQQSDSVAMFIEEHNYSTSINQKEPLKDMFDSYKLFCNDCGYRAVGRTKFGERLRAHGFELERQKAGFYVFAEKK